MTTDTAEVCIRCGATGSPALDVQAIDLRAVVGWRHGGPQCAYCRGLLFGNYRECRCVPGEPPAEPKVRRSPRF